MSVEPCREPLSVDRVGPGWGAWTLFSRSQLLDPVLEESTFPVWFLWVGLIRRKCWMICIRETSALLTVSLVVDDVSLIPDGGGGPGVPEGNQAKGPG